MFTRSVAMHPFLTESILKDTHYEGINPSGKDHVFSQALYGSLCGSCTIPIKASCYTTAVFTLMNIEFGCCTGSYFDNLMHFFHVLRARGTQI